LLFLLITAVSVILGYIQNRIGIEKIRIIIEEAGFFGPIIYIFLHLLTHIAAPIQGSPLLIAAIAIFGKWSFVYTYFVAVISSFTNFWIARKLGRDIVIKFVGKDGMQKIDEIAKHDGIKALILMRFFQGFITDFVSYASGLTSIDFKIYYLVSVLVPLPMTILIFLVFDIIPQTQVFAVMLALGSIFFIIPPVYYYLLHKFDHKHHHL
ncbi:MAG: VTT domain-containing protein, partial [Patescibacteria group bacterium]